MGSVISRQENEAKFIEIDFADTTFHKNLLLDNDINAENGTLSHNGALIASKGEEINMDEYEDDTDDLRYISQIKFIPFSAWNSIKQWGFDLPKGENAENLAVGSTFCAVSTDSNYIRFFSLHGVQTFIMCTTNTIVAMAAYENLLCIISHNGMPMFESQNLKMKVINVDKNYSTVLETEVPLTSGSNLSWMSFSDEGGIYTYDTEGILRNFSFA